MHIKIWGFICSVYFGTAYLKTNWWNLEKIILPRNKLKASQEKQTSKKYQTVEQKRQTINRVTVKYFPAIFTGSFKEFW